MSQNNRQQWDGYPRQEDKKQLLFGLWFFVLYRHEVLQELTNNMEDAFFRDVGNQKMTRSHEV
jgi:hypothetical protein